MTNLLVELQTEELPPKALKSLSAAFAEGVKKSLADQHFLAEDSQVVAYGAPRRLAVRVTNVLARARDTTGSLPRKMENSVSLTISLRPDIRTQYGTVTCQAQRSC